MDILQEEQKVTFEYGEYQVLAITVDGEPVSKLNYDDQLVWEPTSADYFEFLELGNGECCIHSAATNLPEKVVIPAMHNGMRVTEIWSYAFSERSGMKYLYIPHTIKKISDAAFKKCPDLEEVILPQNSELEELGDSVFRNSDSLCRINLENATKLKTIPRNAFRNCGGLYYDMTLPPNLEVIEPWAFFWSGIGRVVFPRTLHTVGACAFCCCPGFITPLIPKSVTDVGFYAFGLTFNADILCEAEDRPGGWNFLWAGILGGAGANWNLTGDSSFNFRIHDELDYDECQVYAGDPDYVHGELTIPDTAYGACDGDSVVRIADWGFSGCTEITGIDIGDTVEHIGNYAFAGCTALKTLTLGDSIKTIGNYAFSGCESITEVVIPYGVTTIGDGAFEGCINLQSIEIPDSVKFIGQDAFNKCSQNLLVICDKLEAENPFVPHVHVWSGWEEVIAPSCSVEGLYERTCNKCETTEFKSSPTSPHMWSDSGQMQSAPTCTNDGSIVYTCMECGATETRSIPATGHSYEGVYYEPTAAECGKYIYTCNECGDSYPEYTGEPALGYSVTVKNGSTMLHYGFPIADDIPERIYSGGSFTFTVGMPIFNLQAPKRLPKVEVTGADATLIPDIGSDGKPSADDKLHITVFNPYADIVIALT